MAEEFEKKENQSGQAEDIRENSSTTEQGSYYERSYHSTGRPQRPRIQAQRAYGINREDNKEEGFRPEGFGSNLQGGGLADRKTNYRPRTNNYGNSYQSRQQQGSYRPRYNNNGEDGSYQNRNGYQNRPNNYQNRGGYRPHYNMNEGEEGGYQSRPTQNSYRPRYNNGEDGGYQNRNGYQNRRGYQNRQGGYNNRGGYNSNHQGGYNNNRQGGYQNRQGGYQNRQGGYGQQGGYRQHNADYDPNAKYSFKKRIEYKEENIDPNEPLRLNKYLANAGVCSRREADEYIQAGAVTVNGEVVKELGTKILRSDEVKFKDQPVRLEKKVYVLLNKPKDYVTTSDDPQQRKTVMDLVKGICPERIYPVGRLDRNTTGVLLLTNDGDIASKLTHPKFLKKKVYHVFLDKPVTPQTLQQISDGIQLEDGEIKADAIEYADDRDQSQVGIEIHSGKNRIVRRIFESLGYRVVKLDRVQFAGLTKKNLRRGDWRYLTEQEVDMLRMGAFE